MKNSLAKHPPPLLLAVAIVGVLFLLFVLKLAWIIWQYIVSHYISEQDQIFMAWLDELGTPPQISDLVSLDPLLQNLDLPDHVVFCLISPYTGTPESLAFEDHYHLPNYLDWLEGQDRYFGLAFFESVEEGKDYLTWVKAPLSHQPRIVPIEGQENFCRTEDFHALFYHADGRLTLFPRP